ncbi:MAG TPA: hypothetical protein VIP51_11590 [Eoetvoesiella sp.]
MKRLLLAGVAALTLLGANTAMARVNVDINVGIPGVIYSEPDYYYGPPVRYVERPRVIVVPERRYYRPVHVYGSRYYDDRREYRHYKKHKHDKHRRRHRHGD